MVVINYNFNHTLSHNHINTSFSFYIKLTFFTLYDFGNIPIHKFEISVCDFEKNSQGPC